ncbi:MAG: amino acid adenylation domain-containing protein [Uliginosibacterium sp.]|nr:amino acid adenylation domain-containing protein [Uliginosibacterium sp.]
MLVGILGIVGRGGAYVPLDPDYPAERLSYMLEDAGAPVVITQSGALQRLPETAARIVCMDRDWPAIGACSGENPEITSNAASLAYLIYTSGSTGRPKGVPITHASLSNLIHWHQQAYEVTVADRATQIASPAFDAFRMGDLALASQPAPVAPQDEATRLTPGRLVQWLDEQRISLSFLPTPLAEAVLRETWPRQSALRVLLTGGDRLGQRPAQPLPFRLVNHYGPTENTVVSTCCEVQSTGTSLAAPPIGRPLPNTRSYQDRSLQPVPVGVPGELLVGGVQLSAGYWNRPELTAEKFIADPFSTMEGARLYRTGDLVRYRTDGNIEFLGRIDDQVKVRGFRIEPGEIEAALRQQALVREAVVVVREDEPGDKRLVAYIVADDAAADVVESLRAQLRPIPPDYMVPRRSSRWSNCR